MVESSQASIRTALVVDDDTRLVASLVGAIARKARAQAVGASSLAEARVLLRTMRPDACLVDLQLPDGSGLELIEEIRHAHHDSRIILFTGYGTMGVGAQAIRAGADDVLAKPATVNEVVQRLCGALPPAAAHVETPTADRAVWEHLHRVLCDCHGNKSLAARKLGINRGTLQRWLDREAPRR